MVALIIALALLSQPSTVAFGDSWTVGYGAYTRAAMWTDRVGVEENLAVAGSTVTEQVEVIRAYQGSASVALWFSCTNDLFAQTPVASYTASISEGVALLRQKGITVYLGTCPGLKERPQAPPNWRTLQEGYNQGVRGVPGVILVDVAAAYNPETQEASFLWWHPNDAGHAAIAAAFLGALHRRVWVAVVTSAPYHSQTAQGWGALL